MATPQHLDALIGEALECANEAAREIRELSLNPHSSYLHKIGTVVLELWEVRSALYKIHPEIKRDFVSESETDEDRFNAMMSLQEGAVKAESEGRFLDAEAAFQRLHTESKFGFFKLCAEAGLWRTQNGQKA
jgi:hypothetical protein